jgi:hypothetical protein
LQETFKVMNPVISTKHHPALAWFMDEPRDVSGNAVAPGLLEEFHTFLPVGPGDTKIMELARVKIDGIPVNPVALPIIFNRTQ